MKYILILFSFVIITETFSQQYMDKIVVKSCECLGKVSEALEPQQYNIELGLCMIEASMPYKKQLKKDYDINLDDIETEGEKLGRIIGLKMVAVCPTALVKMTKKNQENKKEESDDTIEGIITNVESDFFVSFHLKDEAGKVMKYYWLTLIETEQELTTSYPSIVGKTVRITFETKDFFDPKIEEYRQFFIIKKMELL
jgi:hypothetical protein